MISLITYSSIGVLVTLYLAFLRPPRWLKRMMRARR